MELRGLLQELWSIEEPSTRVMEWMRLLQE
jgi:hypothetical protein